MNLNQPKAKTASPSQKFVEIQEIKDDMIILKNGGLRMVVIASSINFELKGSDEQLALISRFQGFLNSLDFPLQILVSSRKLNIDPYLENLRELARVQENDLLYTQTLDYIDFIQRFVEVTDIMNKSFYLIIPFNPVGGAEKEEFLDKILDKIKFFSKPKEISQKLSEEKLQEYKDQLVQRVSHVINSLAQLGIRASILNTEQLIRLFYEFYNPGK